MAIQAVLPEPGHTTERRWPRYAVDVPVQLVTQDHTKVVIVQGRGSALNCGGIAVAGRFEMAVGTQVAVEFAPPCSTQQVTVRCFIRNRQRHTYGLEFIAENDSDYESVGQIETILRSLRIAGFSVES